MHHRLILGTAEKHMGSWKHVNNRLVRQHISHMHHRLILGTAEKNMGSWRHVNILKPPFGASTFKTWVDICFGHVEGKRVAMSMYIAWLTVCTLGWERMWSVSHTRSSVFKYLVLCVHVSHILPVSLIR